MQMAWDPDGHAGETPFYHHWRMATDDRGDFEQLCDKLVARATPPEAGSRAMDIAHSGWDVHCDDTTLKVLGLESALKPPALVSKEFIEDGYNQEYVEGIKRLVNVNEPDMDASDHPQGTFWQVDDPVVAPPLYGRWHALKESISYSVPSPGHTASADTSWIDEVNLDPRWRMVAGIGADVVRQNQEKFMEEAWEQVEQVQQANTRIKMAQLSSRVAQRMADKHIKHPQDNSDFAKENLLRMTTGFHHTVVVQPTGQSAKTMEKEWKDSKVPDAAATAAFRRITRPGLKRNKRLSYLQTGQEHFSKGITYEFNDPNSADNPIGNYYREKVPHDAQAFAPSGSAARNLGAVTEYLNDVQAVEEQLSPAKTISDKVLGSIEVWDEVAQSYVSKPDLTTIMAYPEFDQPLYELLEQMSTDYIIPNVEGIEPNSVTLMALNPKFIEGLFLGVNHEMAREFLWREYPTDMRGTYFSNFWDQLDGLDGNTDPEISPIHLWDNALGLGRQAGTVKSTLVLVIRGELLDKFPDVQIYAQEAMWDEVNDTENSSEPSMANVDADTPRVLKDGGDIKYPTLRARVGKEIVILGFDLTEEDARGMNSNDVFTSYGYYFVFRERPGQIRFGLDVEERFTPGPELTDWNNMSWERAGLPDTIDTSTDVNAIDALDEPAQWGRSSVDMAYILYQQPVMMMIHASEMLMPELGYGEVVPVNDDK